MLAYTRTTHISQHATKPGVGMVSVPARTDPSDPLRLWHYSILLHGMSLDSQSTTRVTS